MIYIGKSIDLTGKKFGFLTVVKRDNERKGYWICQCDCGSPQKSIRRDHLTSGDTIGCGCQITKRDGNKYIDKGGFLVGISTSGDEFYIDHDDYEKVKKYTWYMDSNKYMATTVVKEKIYLHRLIMECKFFHTQVDHINHDTLDNRKSNLRIVDNSKNHMNIDMRKDNKTGTKGVYWSNTNKKWCAQITKDKEVLYLGSYDNIHDAIREREKREKELFGEYAFSPQS